MPHFCSPALRIARFLASKLRFQRSWHGLLALAVLAFTLAACPQAHAEIVRTGYTSIVSAGTAQCLDITGASTSAGAAAIQWQCSGNTNQQWTTQIYSAGAFRIIELQTGDCLVVSGASASAGAPLVQQPCSGVRSELWSYAASGSSFQIVSKSSGLCAAVSGAGTAAGTAIVQLPCSTTPSYLWSFGSGLILPSAYVVAQAGHSGQCLNVNGGSGAAGATIIQWPCAGSANEQWTLQPSGAFYTLVAHNSGLCLSNNGVLSQGAAVLQQTCSATNNGGLWSLQPANGSYQVVSANSGLCLDVSGASQSSGGSVISWPCSGALNQSWSLSPAALPSKWSAITQLPVDPISVANLPNGNLVMWSANDPYTFQGDIGNSSSGQTYTAVFNPTTLASTQTLVTNTGDDMFCPGTANLFDGRILVNGGDSSPKTSLYNWSSGTWASDANMTIPRGYEGDTVLANGSVLTLGGSWSGGSGGKSAEVWTAGRGWAQLTNVPETNIVGPDPQGIFRGDNHLWMFAAPNGLVFHAGPSAQMNWIDPTGTGTITSAGNRADDPYAINGSTVLYDIGLIMKTGGSPAYQNSNAEANTYLININNGTAGVTVNKAAPMAYPRAFSNGVVLPNGQVMIVGGQTYPVPFSDSTAILIPELWDPLTRQFRQLNPMQTPRVYHSTGILLQDGRVYSGGGGQCGNGCSANHFNTEILTPPYLLNADGTAATRPVISKTATAAALGGSLSVTTSAPVASFVMMRLSSTTHSVNNDQRRVPLQIQSVSGSTYSLAVPSNSGVALRGYYWLFALNAQGVPSVGSTILIQ